MDKKSIKKSYYSINKKMTLSIPCSKVILDVTTLEVNAVTSPPFQSPYCGMNDADGDPEFASDDITKLKMIYLMNIN